MKVRALAWTIVCAGSAASLLFLACSDDDTVAPVPSGDAASEAALVEAGGGGGDAEAGADPKVARGKYLVNNVAGCPECHSARLPSGALDPSRYLAGVECFEGAPLDAGSTSDAGDAAPPPGCLNSRNLTNDPSGLQLFTDAEIKAMITTGTLPNGKHLFPIMPYWQFANMKGEDVDAIIAYLRTVPPIVHNVPADDPEWVLPFAVPSIDPKDLPAPLPSYPDQASALRGQYLATTVATCMGATRPRCRAEPSI